MYSHVLCHESCIEERDVPLKLTGEQRNIAELSRCSEEIRLIEAVLIYNLMSGRCFLIINCITVIYHCNMVGGIHD